MSEQVPPQEPAPLKRPPGRPKGLGKVVGSGRKKGTCNKDRTATIERIQKEADPLGFLCKVCRGLRMQAALKPGAKKRTWWYPTGDQRITAAQTLCRKVLPDLKAIENTGELQPVFTKIVREIIEPAGEAAAAIRAEVNSRAGNGVAEPDAGQGLGAGAEPEPAENVRPLFRERNRDDRS